MKADISKFKCYRFGLDGSLYYGEVMYLNTKTGTVAPDAPVDEEARKQWRLVRHGYGLQMYNGNRNEDGVLTKYEGGWDRDLKSGEHGTAVFKDGSQYVGGFKRDKFEGHGRIDWATGHAYEGTWKEGMMEGTHGCAFTHASGRVLVGTFKRNHFLQDRTFVNPLDDEKRLAITLRVHEERVLSQGEKLAYAKRMRIYKVHSEQQLTDALRDTRAMNRVPLIVRTPKNSLSIGDITPRICKGFSIGSEGAAELNLRQVFAESFGNPLKKQEQREAINRMVRKALLTNQLLLLNFDDYAYPESLVEQLHSASHDPNLLEFSGSRAFPP